MMQYNILELVIGEQAASRYLTQCVYFFVNCTLRNIYQ